MYLVNLISFVQLLNLLIKYTLCITCCSFTQEMSKICLHIIEPSNTYYYTHPYPLLLTPIADPAYHAIINILLFLAYIHAYQVPSRFSTQVPICQDRLLQRFNTQYMRNSDMVYVLKMEYVSKINIFGLNMIVKSGLEKIFQKFLHAQGPFHKSEDLGLKIQIQ